MRKRSELRQHQDIGGWLAVTIANTADDEFAPVTLWRLSPVSVRPSLGEYIRQLWGRRHFIMADAKAKAFQTSRGTVLGRIWLVVSPFLNAFVFFVMFGLVLKTGRGVPNFLAYLVVGMNFFSLLQKALTSGGSIIPNAHNMLRAFSFPRASVVLSWSLRTLFDFVPTVLATLVFIIVVPPIRAEDPHVVPGITWLAAPGVLVLGWLFSMGIAFLTASLTSRLPDLKFIWPLIGQFWFYGSGIFFSIDRFKDDPPIITQVMEGNPGYQFLSMSRDLLVYNTWPTVSEWAILGGWALGFLLVGFVIFWSHEESYGREH